MSKAIKITFIICLTIWVIATEKIVADFIIANDLSTFLQRPTNPFLIPHFNLPDKEKDKSNTNL